MIDGATIALLVSVLGSMVLVMSNARWRALSKGKMARYAAIWTAIIVITTFAISFLAR